LFGYYSEAKMRVYIVFVWANECSSGLGVYSFATVALFYLALRKHSVKKNAMKKLFLIALLSASFAIQAQTIESSSRSTTGYIKADGTIENSSRSTVGYIKSDGTIENRSRSTIGYIKSDGTIENSSRSTVGYVKKDGTVENSSRSTIGYIKDDGTVENSSRSTIGYAKGIKKEWAAVTYFFFKFD